MKLNQTQSYKYFFLSLLVGLSGLCAVESFSQSVEFSKKTIPDKATFKKAKEALSEGDNYYGDDYLANFDSALKYFQIAQQINPNNAELNMKIGRSFLDLPSGATHLQALPYFQKALELDPQIEPIIYFYTGKAYHYNSEWTKAIVEYMKFVDQLDPERNADEIARVNKKIRECRNGKELSESPIDAKFENMGSWMNSAYREHSPIIASNESVMFFTARKPNTTGGEKDMDALYFEDIYVTYNRAGGWSAPRNVGAPINTFEHDATVSLSADGLQMIIMREGDLYLSEFKSAQWTEPKPFPSTINGDDTEETSASFADDGNTLYFVTDRSPSIGGRDIWVSKKDALGNWGVAENMGGNINTKYDENGVFMHPDGSTLFFSSEGHNSIGGTDIFKSIYTENGWSAPTNLGIPLNTPYDEQCIVVSADYRNGYYSSKGKDTFGDHDIYKVVFNDVDEPLIMAVDYTPTSLFSAGVKKVEVEGDTDYALLMGSVKDFDDKSPLDARIIIKNRRDNSIVKEIPNNPSTGKFLVALPLDNSYEVTVRVKGYLYFSEDYVGFGRDDKEVYSLNAKIKRIIENQTLVLEKVFFKQASSEMIGTSYDELDKLVQVLRENPGIEIEISGHTDNIGNPAKLIRLSRQRMEAVRTYLSNRGISKSRLEGKGYGGMHPIADNSDPEKRALNRRVEFKVLKVK